MAGLAVTVVVAFGAGSALAEHRPDNGQLLAIAAALRRSIGPDVRVISVEVSSRGPYALVSAVNRIGMPGWIVVRDRDRRWRVVSVISDQGLRCDAVPRAVVADLHLLRYADGRRCSGPYRG